MTTGINPQWKAALPNDPKGVLAAILTMNHVADLAIKEGLDQQSPTKEQIDFLRRQVLMQTEITRKTNELVPTPDELDQAYKANAANYEEAKLQVIYLSFVSGTPAPGSKSMSEEQALAKAQDLVKQLRAGADFAKLVQEHSDDEMSKARGGDFGSIKRGDALPEDLKKAVFELRPGGYSDPIKQPNGFYIFRLVEKRIPPLSEVIDKLNDELRQRKFQAWLRDIQQKYQVTVEKPEFFQRMGK
jgi:hypothetical protein